MNNNWQLLRLHHHQHQHQAFLWLHIVMSHVCLVKLQGDYGNGNPNNAQQISFWWSLTEQACLGGQAFRISVTSMSHTNEWHDLCDWNRFGLQGRLSAMPPSRGFARLGRKADPDENRHQTYATWTFLRHYMGVSKNRGTPKMDGL